MLTPQHKALSIILVLTGAVFVLLYPIMNLLPGAFGWEPHQYEYEQMIRGIYFVLGIFAFIAARNVEQHLGLIWFIALSNLVHGTIMLIQALADPAEHANLYGDVPALIVTGIIIAVLAPKRLTPLPGTG